MSIETLTNAFGEPVATLNWLPNSNGAGNEYARIDDGTIERRPDGTVRVRCQNPTTGKISTYEMTDVPTAFYALGLSAHRCNGVDGWAELANMPGAAGRD